MALTLKTKIAAQKIAVAVVVAVFAQVYAVIWGYFHLNDVFLPWIGRWSWRTRIEVGFCALLFIGTFAAIGFYNMKIRVKDLTYER